MIPARIKRPKMNVRESTVIRLPSHLAWTRGNLCVIAGNHFCSGRMEAHHVHKMHNGGTGMKPGDDRVVPTCASAHAEIHQHGEDAFERKYKLDLTLAWQQNWKASPHRAKWERKVGGQL